MAEYDPEFLEMFSLDVEEESSEYDPEFLDMFSLDTQEPAEEVLPPEQQVPRLSEFALERLRSHVEAMPAGEQKRAAAERYQQTLQRNQELAGLESRALESGLDPTTQRVADARPGMIGPDNWFSSSIGRGGMRLGTLATNVPLRALGAVGFEGADEIADNINRGLELISTLDRAELKDSTTAKVLGEDVAEGMSVIAESLPGSVLGGLVGRQVFQGALGATKGVALVFGAQGADRAMTEAEDNTNMNAWQKRGYAGVMGAIEGGITLAMGAGAKKFGLDTAEEVLMSDIRHSISDAIAKHGIKNLATTFALGSVAEGAEEASISVAQRLWSSQFDLDNLENMTGSTLKAAITGAAARGAFSAANALGSAVARASEEGPDRIRGISAAKQFKASNQGMEQEIIDAQDAAAFEQVTGIKDTTEAFRDSFRAEMTRFVEPPEAQDTEAEVQLPPAVEPKAPPTVSDEQAQQAEQRMQESFKEKGIDPADVEELPSWVRELVVSEEMVDMSRSAPAYVPHQSEDFSNPTVDTQRSPETVGAADLMNPSITSSRNEVMFRDAREIMGDAFYSKNRVTWEQNLSEARQQGIPERAIDMARTIIENPRELNATENAGFVLKVADVKRRFREATKALALAEGSGDQATVTYRAAELDRLEADFETLYTALQRSGSEVGRNLVARKMALDEDFDLVSVKARARSMKKGPLTDAEEAKLTGLTESHDKVEAKYNNAKAELDKQVSEEFIRKAKKRPNPPQNESTLVQKIVDLLKGGCDLE